MDGYITITITISTSVVVDTHCMCDVFWETGVLCVVFDEQKYKYELLSLSPS